MKTSDELKQKRSSKETEMNTLISTRNTEKRAFSDVEATRFDALEQEMNTLDYQVARELKVEAQEVRAAAAISFMCLMTM